jgi:hypothetical protein
MRVEYTGSPEDVIQRCPECDYCFFEDIIPKERRKIKVLDEELPKNHVHRKTIEEICGKEYDGVCSMKYAAMRSMLDDFMAAQIGAIKDFVWDLGKQNKRPVGYEEGAKEWSKEQNLGRGTDESYAKRYREIWNIGLRKNGKNKDKQIFSLDFIYEIVIAEPEYYEISMPVLKLLKKEHKKRDAL